MHDRRKSLTRQTEPAGLETENKMIQKGFQIRKEAESRDMIKYIFKI